MFRSSSGDISTVGVRPIHIHERIRSSSLEFKHLKTKQSLSANPPFRTTFHPLATVQVHHCPNNNKQRKLVGYKTNSRSGTAITPFLGIITHWSQTRRVRIINDERVQCPGLARDVPTLPTQPASARSGSPVAVATAQLGMRWVLR
jgi:hypothetical protein